MESRYIIKNGKKLRYGYTTGSCATGAAKAAALMLKSGKVIEYVEIDTPAGIRLRLKVEEPLIELDKASCAIRKDAGDDPDVTDKMLVFAEVGKRGDKEIKITGGKGIGTITRKGFWGEVGESAINPIPRKMIKTELASLSETGWNVLISAPEGEEIAKRTFNSKIGIKNGISIVGTSGIVEPMSNAALKKTIYVELDQLVEDGRKEIILYLGNYGQRVVEDLNLNLPGVKISNFVGEALLYCQTKKFEKITLIGHVGKLSKVAIGAFNTHSKYCDTRIESFVYYLAVANAPAELIQKVNECASTEEVVILLKENKREDIFEAMKQGCVKRIRTYLKDQNFSVDVMLYSMDYGIL